MEVRWLLHQKVHSCLPPPQLLSCLLLTHCILHAGPADIADAIKDMGALTKLDISNNNIEQGEALKQIIEYCNTKGIELDNHESESGGDY